MVEKTGNNKLGRIADTDSVLLTVSLSVGLVIAPQAYKFLNAIEGSKNTIVVGD
jgi:hypothetical protein